MPRKAAPKKSAPKKRPSATFKSEQQPISKSIYLVVIVLVSAFAYFLFYLEDSEPQKNNTKTNHKVKPSKVQNKPTKNKNPKQSGLDDIQYDFYGLLPNVEIEVAKDYTDEKVIAPKMINSKNESITIIEKNSKSEAYIAKKTISNKTPQTQSKNQALYQLQISAFDTREKAEKLKGRLAFMGVQSNITMRLRPQNKRIYRVRIGPSKDKNTLLKIKKILEKRNFKPFLRTATMKD